MLVDAVSNEVKVKNLYQFYPVKIQSYNDLVEDILNRDYNLLGIWTKACALRNVKGTEGETMTQSTTALMFSPEEILREESVRAITNIDNELYKTVSKRLSELSRKRLDRIANGEFVQAELSFEKVKFLHQNFKSIHEDILLALSAHLNYYENLEALCLDNHENVIIWSCYEGNAKRVIVHYDGKLNEEEIRKINLGNPSFYTLSMAAVYNFDFYYPESSMEIFKYIETNEL